MLSLFYLQIGRIMLRKAISQDLNISWANIQLLRTEKGRPFLNIPTNIIGADKYSFNVSHHGDYTVLASSHNCQVANIHALNIFIIFVQRYETCVISVGTQLLIWKSFYDDFHVGFRLLLTTTSSGSF